MSTRFADWRRVRACGRPLSSLARIADAAALRERAGRAASFAVSVVLACGVAVGASGCHDGDAPDAAQRADRTSLSASAAPPGTLANAFQRSPQTSAPAVMAAASAPVAAPLATPVIHTVD